MKNLKKKYRIARLIILILFIITTIVLIVEALTPSDKSETQSDFVGNVIAKVVNDVNGDQATIIEPEKVIIENKINSANPNDQLALKLNTIPETTRYKSYSFKSSNEEVAKVDSTGNVIFITEGNVIITATNNHNQNIKDEFEVSVSKILATSLDIRISNSVYEDDIYYLTLGNLYSIEYDILPLNITDHQVNIEMDDNPYLEIYDNQINVLEASDNIIKAKFRIDDIEKEIKFKVLPKDGNYIIAHKDIDELNININVKDYSGNNKSYTNPTSVDLYKNDILNLDILFGLATRRKLKIESSDSSIIKVEDLKLNILNTGSCNIKIEELYSNKSYTLKCNVYNKAVIDSNKEFIIQGKYKIENDTIIIQNGESVSINYNFLESTTIKDTKYESSDESILSVGEDGVMTPNSLGDVVVKLKVEDSSGTLVEKECKVSVVRKDFIQNLEEFMYLVRKGIGHFGAFLVLAVFGVLSLTFYFMNKKWKYVLLKMGIILAYGFAFAAFTEFLQTLADGRVGAFKDVLIDFGGYTLGTIIVYLMLGIINAIKYIKNNENREQE